MPRRYEKQIAPPGPQPFKRRKRQPTAAEIIQWIETELVVTEGDLAGQMFKLQPFQRRFVRGFLKNTESALTMGRGSGKTTLCAAIACAALDGPLAIPRGQVAIIAATVDQGAILFEHVKWLLGGRLNNSERYRVLESSRTLLIQRRDTGAQLRVYGSNPDAAHGLAPHLALLDEPARWKSAWSARMYSAIVTALGKQPHSRLVALGTRPERGIGHWFTELLESGGPGVYVQQHWAPDDEDGWPVFSMRSIRAANPMIGHNPSLRREILRHRDKARARGGDTMAQWNSLRLNRGTPEVAGRSRIVSLSAWAACVTTGPPLPAGPACVGIDLGGSSSMTAAALYWPESGLLRCVGAFPSDPPLDERGANDGVGTRYMRMHRRQEIVVYPGKVTPVAAFIGQLHRLLSGHRVIRVTADRYRAKELEQALAEAGVVAQVVKTEREADGVEPGVWPVLFRAVGAGEHGAADIRGFQAEVLEPYLQAEPTLLLESAVSESVIVMESGNPKLVKARNMSRIDAMQAAVLAVGAGRRWRKPDLDEGIPWDPRLYVAAG